MDRHPIESILSRAQGTVAALLRILRLIRQCHRNDSQLDAERVEKIAFVHSSQDSISAAFQPPSYTISLRALRKEHSHVA